MYWGLMKPAAGATSHRPVASGTTWQGHSKLHGQEPIQSQIHAPDSLCHVSVLVLTLVTQMVNQIFVLMRRQLLRLQTRRTANATWEDVFTGLACLKAFEALPAFVHMGSRIISEAYGAHQSLDLVPTPPFHSNTAKARTKERYAEMHKWAL